MIRFSVLSSGSRANCTYVEAGGLRLLIDCGLSCAQTAKRLASIGVDIATIRFILVTHEHNDHIHGIPTISRKFKVPVVCSKRIRSCMDGARIGSFFESGTVFELEGLSVLPVPVSHDARDPVGYVIRSATASFALVTDIGLVTDSVSKAVRDVDALVIESNHDPELLQACRYPQMLKDRIASDLGHLSNESAGRLLGSLDCFRLQHAVLGHLSENSNNPLCARETVQRYTPQTLWHKISLASIYAATPLLTVDAEQKLPASAVG